MNRFEKLCKRNPHHGIVDPIGRQERCDARQMTQDEWKAHYRVFREFSNDELYCLAEDEQNGTTVHPNQIPASQEFRHCQR